VVLAGAGAGAPLAKIEPIMIAIVIVAGIAPVPSGG